MTVWEMKARPRGFNIVIPIEAEVSARSSSSYTRETVTRRLQAIRDDETKGEERSFLRAVLARDFPENPEP